MFSNIVASDQHYVQKLTDDKYNNMFTKHENFITQTRMQTEILLTLTKPLVVCACLLTRQKSTNQL